VASGVAWALCREHLKALELPPRRACLVALPVSYCDKEADGSLNIAEPEAQFAGPGIKWLGRIAQEDVYIKDGYLECPWLSAGINHSSVNFICDLQKRLNVQIYEPGDGVFYSPEAVVEAGREFYRGK
jgi:hypothetical protein